MSFFVCFIFYFGTHCVTAGNGLPRLLRRLAMTKPCHSERSEESVSSKKIPGGSAFPRGKVSKPKVLTDEGQTLSNKKTGAHIGAPLQRFNINPPLHGRERSWPFRKKFPEGWLPCVKGAGIFHRKMTEGLFFLNDYNPISFKKRNRVVPERKI